MKQTQLEEELRKIGKEDEVSMARRKENWKKTTKTILWTREKLVFEYLLFQNKDADESQ